MAFIFIYKFRKVYNYDQLTVSSKKKKKPWWGPGWADPIGATASAQATSLLRRRDENPNKEI